MKIEKISKKIHDIRKALGYATKEQVKKGWKEEMKSVKYLIKEAQRQKCEIGCGGFKYIYMKTKKGEYVKIAPDFSFRVRLK